MVKKCPSCGYNNRDDASFCSSCGASLGVTAVPTLKPVPSVRVVTPVSPGGPIRVPAPGQCFYHPNLPAVYVCNRCGRSICRDDSKAYMDLVLCPQCYQGVVPMTPSQPPAPAYAPQQQMAPPMAPPMMAPPMAPPMAAPAFVPPPPPVAAMPGYPPPFVPVPPPSPRAIWGFILSVIAGILVILNAAALLAPGFYAMWIGVFFWLPALGPASLAFAIGVIIGLILVIGSILMLLGYGTIGSIVVFPLAVLSLIIGGGFVAGFVLGVLGGILGMLGR
ncbi:MAG TPA: zinc-ribbon domain-containing protein [Candidatus Acidoferrales bacterium]|nr:zinc-ribbon domain-containing protein [Candidatus Acidoferrales bacterium]